MMSTDRCCGAGPRRPAGTLRGLARGSGRVSGLDTPVDGAQRLPLGVCQIALLHPRGCMLGWQRAQLLQAGVAVRKVALELAAHIGAGGEDRQQRRRVPRVQLLRLGAELFAGGRAWAKRTGDHGGSVVRDTAQKGELGTFQSRDNNVLGNCLGSLVCRNDVTGLQAAHERRGVQAMDRELAGRGRREACGADDERLRQGHIAKRRDLALRTTGQGCGLGSNGGRHSGPKMGARVCLQLLDTLADRSGRPERLLQECPGSSLLLFRNCGKVLYLLVAPLQLRRACLPGRLHPRKLACFGGEGLGGRADRCTDDKRVDILLDDVEVRWQRGIAGLD
eukprot:m.50860 g.50860  ORF g.50860 m.50860 type:complete len:335 (+) comp6261_c0_seq1:139-1143(+)